MNNNTTPDTQGKEELDKKSYLLGICNWLMETKDRNTTDEKSPFYHVAPITFAELIYRFVIEHPNFLSTPHPKEEGEEEQKEYSKRELVLAMMGLYEHLNAIETEGGTMTETDAKYFIELITSK